MAEEEKSPTQALWLGWGYMVSKDAPQSRYHCFPCVSFWGDSNATIFIGETGIGMRFRNGGSVAAGAEEAEEVDEEVDEVEIEVEGTDGGKVSD